VDEFYPAGWQAPGHTGTVKDTPISLGDVSKVGLCRDASEVVAPFLDSQL
jgi:hypothetical protein